MTPEQENSSEGYLKCEICGCSPEIINLLPIRQADGRLDTLACNECAEKSGAFCLTHQRPHLGFEDGTTACKECIDEKVEVEGPKIVALFKQKINLSDQKEPIISALAEWSNFLTDTFGLSYEENLARAISTVSFRLHKTPTEIIDQLCEEGPEVIFPPFFISNSE